MPHAGRSILALLGLSAATLLVGCLANSTGPKVGRAPDGVARFELDGAPFCFVGANNYYVSYKPRPMVDDLLEGARSMGVSVLRIWGFIDRGSLDGRVANVDGVGSKDGVYFQAWDAQNQRVLYNDGAQGLEGLDYTLVKARELGLKVVVVLTNNWREFGGMDQYLAWYGLSAHEDFYSAARVRRAYKDWLSHLALRVNRFTFTPYRDDPTIFAWELANEPRGVPGTDSRVLSAWAAEMSSYLKSIDPNHLVAVGDEGFFERAADHWTYHADNGVDHAELSALPSIDYATFHMYPRSWGTGFGWDRRWIDDHLALARALHKPTVLEEYGVEVNRDPLGRVVFGLEQRLANYSEWNERILAGGGNGAMFWMLAGRDTERGGVYPDYDHFTVYPGDATSELLTHFAQRFRTAAAVACAASEHAKTNQRSEFVRVRRATPSD